MCYTGRCSHENWHTGECTHPGRGCVVEQEQSRNTVYEGYDPDEDEGDKE